MKKIFVLTGEPSGDKIASEVISQIKTKKADLEYLSVGGTNLEKLGIKTIEFHTGSYANAFIKKIMLN